MTVGRARGDTRVFEFDYKCGSVCRKRRTLGVMQDSVDE